MSIVRRRARPVAIGAVAALVLAGCADSSSDQPDDAQPTDDATDTEVEEEFQPEPYSPPPQPLDADLPDELVIHVEFFVNELESEGQDEWGHLQAPDSLTLQKETIASELDWRVWGPDEAIAVGNISGIWCAPSCTEFPFPARITLCDAHDGEFTRFTVEGPFHVSGAAEQTHGGLLYGVGGEYDAENDFGCMEPPDDSDLDELDDDDDEDNSDS